MWNLPTPSSTRRTTALLLPVLALLLLLSPAFSDEPSAASAESETVALRGRVVNIPAELQKNHTIDIPSTAKPVYGFRTGEGRIYTLLYTRRSMALFMDNRLHEKELVIKGRLFSGTQIVEATTIRSIVDGVIHDLFYYCDICAITALTPEICACCREPVRLVEEPEGGGK